MKKDLLLLGKKILVNESEIVFEYHGEENFQDYFDRIKEMEEWLDVNVEQLHENIIKIHIKT